MSVLKTLPQSLIQITVYTLPTGMTNPSTPEARLRRIQSLPGHPGGGLSWENTHWLHPGHKRHPSPQLRRRRCSYRARRSLTGQEEPSRSDSIHPECPVGHRSLSSVAAVCWTWWGREGKRLSQDWGETVESYLVSTECLSGEARQGSDH